MSILDGAKEPYLEKQKSEANDNSLNVCIPSYTVLKKASTDIRQPENLKTYESDDNESDGSIFSHNSKTHVVGPTGLNFFFLYFD